MHQLANEEVKEDKVVLQLDGKLDSKFQYDKALDTVAKLAANDFPLRFIDIVYSIILNKTDSMWGLMNLPKPNSTLKDGLRSKKPL